jgi:hypothetical protein
MQPVDLFAGRIITSQGIYVHKEHKHIQTSMPPLEFEPTTPVFEQTKAARALNRAATVTGI